jgi:ABC-type uncharacterized transport system auxiliary subunit
MKPSSGISRSVAAGFSSGKIIFSFYPALLLFALFLTGCGKLPLVHYYDIRYPQASALHSTPKLSETLGVAGFTASFSYRQSRLLYREQESAAKVGFYEDRRWVSSPTELVTLAAISHFRQSGLFARVVPNPGDSTVDYVLKGRIVELDEVDKSDGYYANVGLEAELYDLRQQRHTVIWTGNVYRQRKTTARDVDIIANELSLALGEALQELVSKLDAVLPAAKS